MKILTDYVVNGAILQGGSRDPVVVNDQVRLYLDTDAEPEFPAYIQATVISPIVPVNCKTATSYTFEYNEADLLGAKSYLLTCDVVDVVYNLAIEVTDLNTSKLSEGDWVRVAAGGGLQAVVPVILRTAAEGSPVGVITPDFLGQRCIVGTATSIEYTSLDGIDWELTGPSGVINSIAGSYVRATHDGISITYTPYIPAD